MKRHEERCTMNPDRICGMCNMLEIGAAPIESLIPMLPSKDKCLKKMPGDEYLSPEFEYYDSEMLNAALPKLREATSNCPACIMAAIRQSGIPVPAVSDFNFTEECNAIWTQINEENRRNEHMY